MALGRNEEKHISCDFEGIEEECPNECEKCAIAIKTDADVVLAAGQIDRAIKYYKKALFIEPKFAEAWNNLGNAYGMKNEHRNALRAFDKALALDDEYGQALFGKAIALKNIGELEQAVALANDILELYEDNEVLKFKSDLIRRGAKEQLAHMTINQAIEKMTNEGLRIAITNDLLDKKGRIDSERCIYNQEEFAASMVDFCRHRYMSLGDEKFWCESIISAFYGSLCATLLFYQDEEGFDCGEPFKYLKDHVNLEEIDRSADKLLGFSSDEKKSNELWNVIYPYTLFCSKTISKLEGKNDVDAAIQDAAESAYTIGMLYAKRYHEEKECIDERSELDCALEELAASTKDYEYTPEDRSAMCYSISLPMMIPHKFTCDKCGTTASFEVELEAGDIVEQYKCLARKFTSRGYSSTVYCLCDSCADRFHPAHSRYFKNNIIFELNRPDTKEVIYSYPSTSRYNDFEYKVALAFLDGAHTVKELAEVTNTELSPDTYIDDVHEILGNISVQD